MPNRKDNTMSAEIDTSNGQYNVAYLGSRKDVWHRLGQEMLAGQSPVKLGYVNLEIRPDDFGDHDCPIDKELVNDGVIWASFERNNTLADFNEFDSPADIAPFAKKHGWQVFPLRRYEHGQVMYSISSGYPFNDQWDACQVGVILVKKSAFRGEKRRHAVAESWCEAVTRWCNGEYYGYVVTDKHGVVLDSCWGFDDIEYCKEAGLVRAARLAIILSP